MNTTLKTLYSYFLMLFTIINLLSLYLIYNKLFNIEAKLNNINSQFTSEATEGISVPDNKPYILVLESIDHIDEEVCSQNENCMDLMLLSDLPDQPKPLNNRRISNAALH